PQRPKVASLCHGGTAYIWNQVLRSVGTVGVGLAELVDCEVHLCEAEASDRYVELEINQGLEFNGKNLSIPSRIECQLVVGQDVSAPLRVRQMRKSDRRHRFPAEELCSFNAAMACNDFATVGDKNGIGEAKTADARGDLFDLF